MMTAKPENEVAKLPCEVVVVPNRKRGSITDWGSAPFYVFRTGQIIPDAFCFQSLLLGEVITMKTRVREGGQNVAYQFILNKTGSCGAFCKTQTSALDSLARKLQEENYQPFASKYRNGTNGRLHAGVTYPTVQEMIRRVFSFPAHAQSAGAQPAMGLPEAPALPAVPVPAPPPPLPAQATRHFLQQQKQTLLEQQQELLNKGAFLLTKLRQGNNQEEQAEAAVNALISFTK